MDSPAAFSSEKADQNLVPTKSEYCTPKVSVPSEIWAQSLLRYPEDHQTLFFHMSWHDAQLNIESSNQKCAVFPEENTNQLNIEKNARKVHAQSEKNWNHRGGQIEKELKPTMRSNWKEWTVKWKRI